MERIAGKSFPNTISKVQSGFSQLNVYESGFIFIIIYSFCWCWIQLIRSKIIFTANWMGCSSNARCAHTRLNWDRRFDALELVLFEFDWTHASDARHIQELTFSFRIYLFIHFWCSSKSPHWKISILTKFQRKIIIFGTDIHSIARPTQFLFCEYHQWISIWNVFARKIVG